MNYDDLKREIFSQIEEKQIQPRARWKFVVLYSALWLAAIAALVIGSFATSAGIFVISNSDLGVHRSLHGFSFGPILKSIPALWILSLVVFIVIADIAFKYTKKGYRYTLWVLILGSIALSLVGGSVLYTVGAGHAVEEKIGRHIPFYEDVFERKAAFWMNPEEGRLYGSVSLEDDTAILRDSEGDTWVLSLERLPAAQHLVFTHASSVAVIGFFEDDIFIVCHARPWVFNGALKMKPKGPPPKNVFHPEDIRVPKDQLDMLRKELNNRSFSERNISEIRNTLCEPSKARNKVSRHTELFTE